MKQEQIKFRAWDRVGNTWCDYVDYHGSTETFIGFSSDGHVCTDIDVIRFTGLKDKNGVDIYEGDIIPAYDGVYVVDFDEWDNGELWEENESGYGFYLKGIGKVLDTSLRNAEEYYEVIGNIYSNPELSQ